VSKDEMFLVISSIYNIVGHFAEQEVEDKIAREHVEKVFNVIYASLF